jgi:hypothetical protein
MGGAHRIAQKISTAKPRNGCVPRLFDTLISEKMICGEFAVNPFQIQTVSAS